MKIRLLLTFLLFFSQQIGWADDRNCETSTTGKSTPPRLRLVTSGQPHESLPSILDHPDLITYAYLTSLKLKEKESRFITAIRPALELIAIRYLYQSRHAQNIPELAEAIANLTAISEQLSAEFASIESENELERLEKIAVRIALDHYYGLQTVRELTIANLTPITASLEASVFQPQRRIQKEMSRFTNWQELTFIESARINLSRFEEALIRKSNLDQKVYHFSREAMLDQAMLGIEVIRLAVSIGLLEDMPVELQGEDISFRALESHLTRLGSHRTLRDFSRWLLVATEAGLTFLNPYLETRLGLPTENDLELSLFFD